MTAADFFNAARAYRRELTGTQDGLTTEDVAALNAATVGRWKAQGHQAAGNLGTAASGVSGAKSGLSDPALFFASIRAQLGGLQPGQVDGFNRLLSAMGAAGWPIAWTAYGLATAWWETARQMHPVEEGYYLGAEKAKRHQRGLRYFPWYGRGDVQLTWEANYRLADGELGLAGKLIADPDLALDPETSARILVWGMAGGKFTGKSLAHYLPRVGAADREAFKQARKIINGTDKAAEIAEVALKMQRALQEGQWS